MEEIVRILRPYRRRAILIILAMIGGFFLAKKYLSYTVPMYEATTKIKLADLQEGVTGNNLFKDLDVFSSTNKIATEIEVLKSQILLEKTLSKLDFQEELYRVGKIKSKQLYNEKPILHEVLILDSELYDKEILIHIIDEYNFTAILPDSETVHPGTFGDSLIIENQVIILLDINTQLLAIKANLQITGNYKIIHYSNRKIQEKISANLDVVSVDKDVAILRIIFKNEVPEKAAAFTNALAKAYIEDYIDEKFKTARVTSDFLDNEITKIDKELFSSEMKIQGYRNENNIINIRQETETDLRKLSQLKIQKTNVLMSLEAIQELNSYIKLGKDDILELAPNFEAFTDLLSTEMIKKIKELQSEKSDLEATYKPGHESFAQIDSKLKFYTDYFIESINNTEKALTTKFNKLKVDIEEAEKVFIGLPERERKLHALNRDFQIHQQSYIFLNEKRIEAEIAKAAKHAFHRIINAAKTPKKPVSPNRPIIIIVSTLLGFISAVVFIFLVNTSKARINDLTSIERLTDINIIYQAPHFKNTKNAYQYFKNLSLKLDMEGHLSKNSILTFTSFDANHGATYHLNLFAQVFENEKRNFKIISFNEKRIFNVSSEQVIYMLDEQLSSMTFQEIKNWVMNLASQNEILLIDNFDLSQNPKAILFMKMASESICVVDTRKTYLRSIPELQIIKEKNNLTNLSIALNNDSYSPSLLKDLKWMIKKLRATKLTSK